MGCSSSMVQPYSSDKHTLVCSNLLVNGNVYITGNSANDTDIEIGSFSEQRPFKRTCNELAELNEKLERAIHDRPSCMSDSADSVDTGTVRVVPYLSEDMFGRASSLPKIEFQSRYGSGRVNRSHSLPTENLRSVLKKSKANHRLANRPIKTVTFLDPITVVAVR